MIYVLFAMLTCIGIGFGITLFNISAMKKSTVRGMKLFKVVFPYRILGIIITLLSIILGVVGMVIC